MDQENWNFVECILITYTRDKKGPSFIPTTLTELSGKREVSSGSKYILYEEYL